MADQFSNFDNLSDEQILAEIQRLSAANSPEPPVQKAAPVVQQPETPKPEPVTPVADAPQPSQLADLFKPGKYDHDEYAKLLVKDAREAQDYVERTRFGRPVTELIPAILQVVAVQDAKLKQLEAQRFLDTTEDYKPTVANKDALDKVISSRGWQPSYEAYKDAWAIAKAEGLVQPEPKHETRQESRREETPYVPPRPASRANLSQEEANPDIIKWAENASLEDLHALLQKNGGFRH